MNKYDLIIHSINQQYMMKYAADSTSEPLNPTLRERYSNRANLGAALAFGFNGPDNITDHTWKSRGRQALAGTAIAAGGAGGGYLGYKGTGWLNNKLGLTDDRGGWRKWLGRGIRAAGTGIGIAAGAGGGSALAGLMAGGTPEERDAAIRAVRDLPKDATQSELEAAGDTLLRQIRPI